MPRSAVDGAVLFVHGIGRQQKGATLAIWSPQVREYLESIGWRSDLGGGDVREPTADLPSAKSRSIDEYWRLHTADGQSATWLATESWWAQVFRPPTAGTYARWAALVFPRFAVYQLFGAYVTHWNAFFDDWRGSDLGEVDGQPANRPRAVLRLAVMGIGMTISTLLRCVAVLMMLAATVIALRFHSAGRSGLMNWFIDYLGDSLAAVVDDPSGQSARRAMLATIRADIDRCLSHTRGGGRVIVVAHSQGAMLARQALADQPADDRLVLLTVGAGVAPLHALVGGQKVPAALAAWAAMAALVAAAVASGLMLVSSASLVAAVLGGASTSAQSSVGGIFIIWLVVMLGAVAIVVAATPIAGFRRLLPALEDLRLGDKVPWIEFSSQYDPVSCGPLLDGRAAPVCVLGNSYSLLDQHVTYHRNRFVLFSIASHIVGPTQRLTEREADQAWLWSRRRLWALRFQSAVLLTAVGFVILKLEPFR